MASNALHVDKRAGKYLTFGLGNEEFAIQVLRVREIIGVQQITSIPQAPGYVKGVINLRGRVIPVVDLRLRFGMPEQPNTPRTCIIVVQIGDETAGQTGLVVDEVSEVVTLKSADIEDTPDFGRSVSTSYLLGIAKLKGRVKILLDMDAVMKVPGTREVAGAVV